MTTEEKMRSGRLYTDMEEHLEAQREHGKELVYDYNMTRPREVKRRRELLEQLLGSVGDEVWLEPPIHFAYGNRTHIGDYFYANFNLTIVDDVEVFIGNHVMMAPNVMITATGHPVHPDLRKHGEQFSFPVRIEDDVWIGSNVVIMPGVTIGKGSVIGAGSIVTKDVPEYVVAVGNPCRVLRPVTDRDKEYYYKDLKIEE